MKSYDLLGQKFGKLIVVEQTTKNGKKAWKCQCDCGNYRIAYATDLVKGKITSCGCGRKKDLTNQQFGELIALKPTEKKDSNNSWIWECQCSCGKIHYVSAHNLLTGNVKSCGHTRAENVSLKNKERAWNLLGQRFGYLTVIDKAPNQGKSTCWKCKCDCGNEVIVNTNNLVRSRQISCGCFNRSKGEEKIKQLLDDNNIIYQEQYSFEDLILPSGKLARYDFYLLEYNCLIEYDGIQHFQSGT